MPGIIFSKIVGYIKDLKNVRAFGLLLKIDPGKLDEIERKAYSSQSMIELIVIEWLRQPMGNADRWEELGRILLEPAVDEPTIASELRPNLRRGSSVDSAISVFSNRSSFSLPSSPSFHEMSYFGM